MSPYVDLPLSAQTAYAQLFEAALAANLHRTVADLRGSFARKRVSGHEYWYFQFTGLEGKLKQVYLGPATPQLEALIAVRQSARRADPLTALARSAQVLGMAPMVPRQFRVLRRLADYGFFDAGSVLVGTHAFLAAGNALGVRWATPARTDDLDFEHAGKNLSLALPSTVAVDTPAAIASLELGLLPARSLSGAPGPMYLNPKEPEFRLDFLTPLSRRNDAEIVHPRLGVALQPLKFLEFVLEDVTQVVLFCAEGAVIASIPSPARYALHKLLVYGERSVAFRTKATKDLVQAAALLSLMKRDRPGDVESAWRDLVRRGSGWRRRVRESLSALERVAPELDATAWLSQLAPV